MMGLGRERRFRAGGGCPSGGSEDKNIPVFSFPKRRFGCAVSAAAAYRAVIGMLLGLAVGTVLAGDLVWTNLAGGNWTAVTNWNPNGVPGAADTAWITNNGGYSITLNSSVSVATLHLGGITGTQTLSHTAGTLTLGGDSDSSSQGVYGLNGGTLTGSGTLSLNGPFNWSGGSLGGIDQYHPASLTLTANGGLVLAGAPKYLFGGTLVITGTGLWTGGLLYGYNTALLTNASTGTLDLQADGNVFWIGNGTPSMANAGLLRKIAGTGSSTIAVSCGNSGNVQANSGTLALVLDDSTGNFTIAAGATLSCKGTAILSGAAGISGAGNFIVTGGALTNTGTFAVNGTNTFNGGTACFLGSCSISSPLVVSGGNLVLNGTGAVNPSSLSLSSGSLSGSQAVTVIGPFNWSGGNLGGIDQYHPTSFTVTANGGLALSGSGKYLFGGTLVNTGSGLWTGGTLYGYNAALLTNSSAGTLDLQADGNVFWIGGGTPSMANAGLLRKSAGTGTGTITVPCGNSGTVQANSGTLALTLTDSTGSFTITAGATLSLNGTANLSPASGISGDGNVTVVGGALTNQSAFAVNGTNTFSGGTACFLGNCRLTGPVLVSSGNLVLNGTGQVNPSLLNLSSGSLSGSQAVTVTGPFNWSGGYLGGIDQFHPTSLTVTANGGLALSGSYKYLLGGTLVNAGSGLWTGGTVEIYNTALLTNSPAGTLDLQADGNAFHVVNGSPALANAGLLRKNAGTGTSTITVPCGNSGTVQANSGTLALTLTDSTGSFTIAAGAMLGLNGTANLSPASGISGDGNVTVIGGALTNQGAFAVNGTNTFSGGTACFLGNCSLTSPVLVSGGNLILNGAGPVNPISLNLSSGSLSGSQAVTVTGLFNWSGGSLGGIDQFHPTSLTVTANGGLALSGSAKYLFGGTLVNTASGLWTGGTLYGYNTALLTNTPAGTLDLQADGNAFYLWTGSPALANAGLLRKSAGTGTSTITIPCGNSGTVQANSGTLAFTGAFVQTAGRTILAGGGFAFGSTPMRLLGGNLTGPGAIAGSISNSAALDLGAAPGSLSISGNYTESSQAQLQLKLGGTTAGTTYDQLVIGGNAALAGTLSVSYGNGFTPAVGDVYTTLVCKARSGVFSSLHAPSSLGTLYTTNTVLLEPGNASPTALLLAAPVQIACHTVWLQATGSDPDGTVTNLAIFMGTNLLVSQPGPAAQVAFTHDFPEDVVLTALATDNKGVQGGTNVTVSFLTLATNVLDPVGFQTNKAFKLCLEGQTGKSYKIQASTNLTSTNWTDLGLMENTNGIWRYLDLTTATANFRCYRAQQLP